MLESEFTELKILAFIKLVGFKDFGNQSSKFILFYNLIFRD